jgi:hypothetical protein
MNKILLLGIALTFSKLSFAGYDANFSGKITNVLTYTGSTQILIRVEGQPTSHPTCTTLDFLSIAPDISTESRNLVMSRILSAYATGEKVNIGYDKTAGCVGSRIRVHRVG